MGSKKDAQLFNDYIKNKRSYADGGTIDEDPPQNTSERPITNFDPKGDPYNPTYGYNPGAGYVRSVFDLYDAPVIGDALSIYDNDYLVYQKLKQFSCRTLKLCWIYRKKLQEDINNMA